MTFIFLYFHKDQTKRCMELNCSHECKLTSKGPKCLCPAGMEPSVKNVTQCQDFDECSINAICDQKCKNTPGSYECSCVKGYSKSGNRCIAINGKYGKQPCFQFIFKFQF